MLVSMKSMLLHAHENNYAVMACNCVDMEQARAIISAASLENSPVIINVSPRQIKEHADSRLIAKIVHELADRTHVPVALNLDHGQNIHQVNEVIKAGFSSIMIDASALSYKENIEETRMITLYAHDKNVSVEAELGHVGQALASDDSNIDLFTNVQQAKEFVEITQVDCLAVAIGTAHGNYPKGLKPKLDFARLKELKLALDMPLVLHGGSGAGEDNIKKCVKLGINKINVCTDLFKHAVQATQDMLESNPSIDYMDLQKYVESSMIDFIRSFMKLIGSSNQYNDKLQKNHKVYE